jgi:NitT/TauT family transport system permease protein
MMARMKSIAVAIAVLLLWEAACRSGWIPRVILPAPSMILLAAIESWRDFLEGAQITLVEMLIATLLASSIGIGLGCLLGATQLGSAASGPILGALFAVPLITWYPLFMTWFGLGSASKIAYGIVSGVFPIAIGTLNGIRGVDAQKILFGRVIGCTPLVLLTRIIFPLALPAIVTGLRIGIALTVIGIIVAEMLSSLGGIGYLISYNRTMFNTGHVYFGILLAMLCAYGVNRGLTHIEQRFSAWRDVT